MVLSRAAWILQELPAPLVFGIAYAVLAVLTSTGVPYALWATLIVSLIGVVGLTANWAKIPHEKTVEKLCWALGAAIMLIAAALLFLR